MKTKVKNKKGLKKKSSWIDSRHSLETKEIVCPHCLKVLVVDIKANEAKCLSGHRYRCKQRKENNEKQVEKGFNDDEYKSMDIDCDVGENVHDNMDYDNTDVVSNNNDIDSDNIGVGSPILLNHQSDFNLNFNYGTEDYPDMSSGSIFSGSSLSSTRDHSIYLYQELLYKKYMHPSFQINNKNKKPVKLADVLDLLKLKHDLYLSTNCGNMLINTFSKIMERNCIEITIPRNFRSINYAFNKNLICNVIHTGNDNAVSTKGQFSMIEYNYHLCDQIFPGLQQKSTKAYSFNLMELIAEELLNCDPKLFRRKPDIRHTTSLTSNIKEEEKEENRANIKEEKKEENRTNIKEEKKKENRIYEDYTTGKHFEDISLAVNNQGSNATSDMNKYTKTALAIGFTLDETTTKSRARSETPVCFYILNNFDANFRMILVGYAPKSLPYKDIELKHYLIDTYNCTSLIADKIIQIQKRKLQLRYLHDIFKVIKQYEQTGLFLRVGGNQPKSFDIHAFIHIAMITGDTMSSDFLAGTSLRRKFRKCRLCNCYDCTSPMSNNKEHSFRDDKLMEQLGILGEEAYVKALDMKSMSLEDKDLTKLNLDTVEKQLSLHNMRAGYNPLIDLFRWQNDPSRHINGFFEALVPDYLHTVEKGIIEYALTWSIHCIMAIGEIDNSYALSILKIDERIEFFPQLQSLDIWGGRRIKFKGVISDFFSKPWKNESKGTGYYSGTIEAWKNPILLQQLLYTINKDICPFNDNWLCANSKKLSYKWNPGKTIVNALAATIEMHFFCKTQILTSSSIPFLRKIVQNAQAQVSLLWIFRKDLIEYILNKKKENLNEGNKVSLNKMTGFYQGIKMHLASHIDHFKQKHGAFTNTTNTEMSESYHKFVVKENFESTNKQPCFQQSQMLQNIRRITHCENIVLFNKKNMKENTLPTTTDCEWSYTSTKRSGFEICIYYDNNLYIKDISKNILKNKSIAINTRLVDLNDITIFIEEEILINSTNLPDNFCQYWKLFKIGGINLHLQKAVDCRVKDNDNNNGVQDYIIRCAGEHIPKIKNITQDLDSYGSLNICSFIEVFYASDDNNDTNESKTANTAMAHLVSILNFNNHDVEVFYLIIAWLKPSTLKKKDKLLPNPCYEYSYDKQYIINQKHKPYLQIIDVGSMCRPAYIIPCTKTGNIWSKTSMFNKSQLKEIALYCIPYERVCRRSCEGYVSFMQNNDIVSSTLTNNRNVNDLDLILSPQQLNYINTLVTNYIGPEIDENMNNNQSNEDENIEIDDLY